MTPASNSEARKKAEDATRPPSVLVEIPVDVAERLRPKDPSGQFHDRVDAITQCTVTILAALDARITDRTGQ